MCVMNAEQYKAEKARLETKRHRYIGDFQRKSERGWLYKEGAFEKFKAGLAEINDEIAALDTKFQAVATA